MQQCFAGCMQQRPDCAYGTTHTRPWPRSLHTSLTPKQRTQAPAEANITFKHRNPGAPLLDSERVQTKYDCQLDALRYHHAASLRLAYLTGCCVCLEGSVTA